jgi:hypothetical protein
MNKRMIFLEIIVAQGERDGIPAGEVLGVDVDLIQSKLDEAPDNEVLEYLNANCEEDDIYGTAGEILDILGITFDAESKKFIN